MDGKERVEFRRYREGDLAACRGLWEQLTVAHRELYGDPSIGGSDPGMYFDEHLKKTGAGNIWVAECGGLVVGLMGLEVEGGEMTVEPMVVSEAWRGKGIGKQLMGVALKEAAARDVPYLNVRPVARNVAAMKFFNGCGMTNVGHVELFVDLKGRKWKDGLNLHGIDLRY